MDSERTCPVCSAAVVGDRRKVYCNRKCKERALAWGPHQAHTQHLRRVRAGKVTYGPPVPNPHGIKCPVAGLSISDCNQCARPFARHGRAKYCSDRCRLDNINNRVMGLYRTAHETGRVKQAMHWRYELVRYLRDRDGDRCALCGKRMDFQTATGTRGSDDGATVDHILPRSLGGGDELANLQLAHWACNRAKGNRGGDEQLRLIG